MSEQDKCELSNNSGVWRSTRGMRPTKPSLTRRWYFYKVMNATHHFEM